jgi:hypothetical protein
MSHPARQLSLIVLLVPVVIVLALAAFAWPSANLAPRDLPLGLVGPAPAIAAMSSQLTSHAPGAFSLHTYASDADARAAIRNRDIYGAIVVSPSGTRLLVASAASALVAQALTQQLLPALAHAQAAQAAQNGQGAQAPAPTVVDVVPAAANDPHGLVLGAVVLPLVLAGVLTGLLITLFSGPGLSQILALVVAASLGGLSADFVAQGWLGALDGNWLVNSGVFALTILAIAGGLAGLGVVFGRVGLALGVVLLVFIGNPFSGVATGPVLLPKVVAVLGQLLPPGAGGNLLRSTAFFGGNGGGGSLAVLSVWSLLGLGAIALAALRQRPRNALAG